MGTIVKVAGWVVAGAALALAAVLFSQIGTIRVALDEQRAEYEVRIAELEHYESEAQQAREERQTAEEALNEAHARIAELEEQDSPARGIPTDASRPDAAAGTGKDTEEEGRDNPMSGVLRAMMENPEMLEAQSKMMVNMQYSSLLKDLALPLDVESQVREILARYGKEQMTRGLDALKGEELSGKQMKQREDEIQAAMISELSGVFTQEEMAIFEEYEENKNQHMLEQSFDMQLGMFSSGLTPENREIAKIVLAEEVLVIQQEFEGSDEPFDMRRPMEGQLAAFERARDRLYQEFDEEQYAVVDGFIDQMATMMRAQATMMEQMMGDDDEEEEQAPEEPERPRPVETVVTPP